MLTKIRRIGNSQGILLSKTMLDQVEIDEYVDVEVKGNAIVIIPAVTIPREKTLRLGSITTPVP